MIKKIFASLFLLFLFEAPLTVFAAGISVTPSSLVYYLPVKDSVTKKITVENAFASPQIYEVYSDEFSDLVKITPGSFRLEPGEKQEVRITVKSQNSGNFAGFVSVVASDINRRQFNASTGAKIPLQITVLTPAPSFFQKNFIWFIIIICCLIILLDLLIIAGSRKKLTFWQKILRPIKSFMKKIKH